jgi:hypothetical protein
MAFSRQSVIFVAGQTNNYAVIVINYVKCISFKVMSFLDHLVVLILDDKEKIVRCVLIDYGFLET